MEKCDFCGKEFRFLQFFDEDGQYCGGCADHLRTLGKVIWDKKYHHCKFGQPPIDERIKGLKKEVNLGSERIEELEQEKLRRETLKKTIENNKHLERLKIGDPKAYDRYVQQYGGSEAEKAKYRLETCAYCRVHKSELEQGKNVEQVLGFNYSLCTDCRIKERAEIKKNGEIRLSWEKGLDRIERVAVLRSCERGDCYCSPKYYSDCFQRNKICEVCGEKFNAKLKKSRNTLQDKLCPECGYCREDSFTDDEILEIRRIRRFGKNKALNDN